MKTSRYKKRAIYSKRETNEKRAKPLDTEKPGSKKDPIEAINGILADLDLDSVELQHKARRLWASKITKDLKP